MFLRVRDTPRHGSGHGPRLQWLLPMGPSMYELNEMVGNFYDEVLSHKLKKRTRCEESILCPTYFNIHIWNSIDIFIVAHHLQSTVRSAHSMCGRIVSTGREPNFYSQGKWGAQSTIASNSIISVYRCFIFRSGLFNRHAALQRCNCHPKFKEIFVTPLLYTS